MRPKKKLHRFASNSEQTVSHPWVMFGWRLFVSAGQWGVFAMADENELKQVQEPAQEQQQQQSTEQKPTEPPPETQVAETQAPEAAEAPSENPNP
jgi:hypothetical protein